MTFLEAYKNLCLKFTSGNEFPVRNANITRDEWDAINQYLKFLAPGIKKELKPIQYVGEEE